jgi:hypothetical protein
MGYGRRRRGLSLVPFIPRSFSFLVYSKSEIAISINFMMRMRRSTRYFIGGITSWLLSAGRVIYLWWSEHLGRQQLTSNTKVVEAHAGDLVH